MRPDRPFAAAAASVLSGIIDDHGSEEQYQQNVWGRALEASEVDAMCDAYLNTNNLLGRVQFVWSPETRSRASVSARSEICATCDLSLPPGWSRRSPRVRDAIP